MSSTRAILRLLARLHVSPGKALEELNHVLVQDFPPGKFVTMIYAVLDAKARKITLASAGHLRPLLVNGSCSFLDVETGLPLGVRASSYPERTVDLKPGTKLLLYTDGITEAANHHDEEFGPDRLLDFFGNPEACVDELIQEVRRFGGGNSHHTDDATAVLVRSR